HSVRLQSIVEKLGIGGHHGLRYYMARIVQVDDIPLVAVLDTDMSEIRSGPLRAPEHRVVILRFHREGEGTVALHLILEGAENLGMAGIATFPDVDLAPRQFERRVDPHVGRLFHRRVAGRATRGLSHPSTDAA